MPSENVIIRCFFIAFVCLAMPGHAIGEDKKEPPKIDPCKAKKVSTRGRPNRIQAMASMNAVISWINMTKKKHGKEYALWHTASDKKISCEKIKDSDYYICFAGGKPCKPFDEEKNKKGKNNPKLKNTVN